MQEREISVSTLSNGFTVIGEPRSTGLQSVSLCLYLSIGVLLDVEERLGAGLLLAELFNRGSTRLASKEFRAEFERRGINFVSGGGFDRCVVRIDCMSDQLDFALAHTFEAISQPRFDDESALQEAKRTLLNDIRARDDEPAGIAANRLVEWLFPSPFNRPREGSISGIEGASGEFLAELHAGMSQTTGALLAWCGDASQERIESLLSKHANFSATRKISLPTCGALIPRKVAPLHIEHPVEQRSVMIGFESAPVTEAGYFPAKVASLCLGGGLFARLFNELREKRGLVYDISCSHSSNRERGWMVVGFACETSRFSTALELTQEIFRGFSPTEQELTRAQRQVRLMLAAGAEARSSRCETLAAEYFFHGRIRGEQELVSAVQAVDERQILTLFERYPPFTNFVQVSVGGELS